MKRLSLVLLFTLFAIPSHAQVIQRKAYERSPVDGWIMPCTSDNVRCVDPTNTQNWAGATPDEWIASATASLPTVNGIPKGTILIGDGNYAMAGTVNPTGTLQQITYLCNKGRVTMTWASPGDGFNINSGAIIGCELIGPGSGISRGINSGANNWVPATAYPTNTVITPTFANANGHFFIQTASSCKSGSLEPTWPVGNGATVTDNTCIWKETGLTVVTLRDNHLSNWGLGASINTGSNEHGWIVQHNVVENNPVGEGMLQGTGSQHFLFFRNTFRNNFSNGLDTNGRNNESVEDEFDFNGGANGARACWAGGDQNGLLIATVTPTDDASNNIVIRGHFVGNAEHGFKLSEAGGNISGNIITGNDSESNGTCIGGTIGDGFNFQLQGNGIAKNNVIAWKTSKDNPQNDISCIDTGTGTYSGNVCGPNNIGSNTPPRDWEDLDSKRLKKSTKIIE